MRGWASPSRSCCRRGDAARAVAASIPARIVSTSPSITETLFALGLGDRVVGVSTFCRYPEAVRSLPKVGTVLKPEPEIIARLKPGPGVRPHGPNSAVAQLASLGIRTAVVDRGTLPSVFSTIRQIGAAAGVPARANGWLADIERRPWTGSRRGRGPAAAHGADHRRAPHRHADRHHRGRTGLVPARHRWHRRRRRTCSRRARLEYPRISMETVISLAPDVIVDVGEMGESPADSERRRHDHRGACGARQTLVKAVREGAPSTPSTTRRSWCLVRASSMWRGAHGGLAPWSRPR